ncbi:MAG: ATP-binding cassette domain-containing protein [Gemmataceae bacterium]|nr:ATP-binding cassette domain-containing protein [Gemmataceae bacterium]
MIVVENLTVRAGSFALEGVSFSLATGQYGVLMGRTGSGKTTLLEALCGLKRVASGNILLLGRDVTHLPPAERGVGYVPQDRALFPTMSVWQHLAFALAVRRWPGQAISERVGELAELLGLGRLLDRKPHGLSGGEAQRVALGRALSFRPAVLLLDEPLSALDEETREEMCDLLGSVRQHAGVTTLHITHNPGEANRLADRLFLLREGRVEEASTSEPASPSGIVPARGGLP